MKIYINGKYLTQIRLKEGGYILYEIISPKRYWKKGQNVIKFAYSYAIAPAKVSNNPDNRILAVAFGNFSLKIFKTFINGGFELWKNKNEHTYWNIWGPEGTSSINRDSKNQNSGTYCCRFDIDTSNSPRCIYQGIKLEANEYYVVEFWYKTAADKSCVAVLENPSREYLNPSGNWQSEWTSYTGNISSTDGAKNVFNFVANISGVYHLKIITSYATNSSIYIDDISLKPGYTINNNEVNF
jgi:hypothetical protein